MMPAPARPLWPYVAKGVRQTAYGTATVAVPVWLLRNGFSPLSVGALVALALSSGAVQSWLAGWLTHSYSPRSVALASSVVMGLGALLLLGRSPLLIPLAAVLGGMNIGGQEVGPFTAIEQVAIQRAHPSVRRFAWYNATGTMGMAIGTLAGGAASIEASTILYVAAAAALGVLYAWALPAEPRQPRERAPSVFARGYGVAERLATLFAVDAFAGGFVAQGFIVYWLTWRYHPNVEILGAVLAAANVLAMLSLFVAARLAARFGLLRTMVFTHLPSNVLLALIPIAPSFGVAAGLLLARSALSQMDVPTRQALVLGAVPEDERLHAAGVTNAVRPAAAALAPTLAGLAAQTAAMGAPFFIAGAIKSGYDLTLYLAFHRIAEAKAKP